MRNFCFPIQGVKKWPLFFFFLALCISQHLSGCEVFTSLWNSMLTYGIPIRCWAVECIFKKVSPSIGTNRDTSLLFCIRKVDNYGAVCFFCFQSKTIHVIFMWICKMPSRESDNLHHYLRYKKKWEVSFTCLNLFHLCGFRLWIMSDILRGPYGWTISERGCHFVWIKYVYRKQKLWHF